MTEHEEGAADNADTPSPTGAENFDLAEYQKRDGRDWGKIIAALNVEKARSGNVDSAFEILRDFVGAIDQYNENTWTNLRSAPIHWEYVKYVADAFEKIIRAEMQSPRWKKTKWSDFEQGEAIRDANLALGVKISKAGRRAGTTTHDSEGLAAAYNLLLFHGMSPKAAKLSLKEKIGADVRSIEKANEEHVTYRTYFTACLDPNASASDKDFAAEIMKVGAKPYAAEIAAILAARKSSVL